MGMTDELSVGYYFDRLTMIDMTFGNVDSQLKRFGLFTPMTELMTTRATEPQCAEPAHVLTLAPHGRP